MKKERNTTMDDIPKRSEPMNIEMKSANPSIENMDVLSRYIANWVRRRSPNVRRNFSRTDICNFIS